jgi:hypothetical protein
MSQNTISISLRGNRDYRLALNIIAARRGKLIGDIVRDAIDEMYGPEIADTISKNFTIDETSKHQTKRKGNKKEQAV